MRLHPAVTEEEAYTWLKAQITDDGSSAASDDDLDATLRSAAEAMAAISRVVLDDDVEPMFP